MANDDYVAFLQRIPSKWVQGPNMQAWQGAIGGAINAQAANAGFAVKQRMPTKAASDALGALGDERQLDRGPADADIDYALRLRSSWEIWPTAGWAIGMLCQLHWAGFDNAVIVQQNGHAFQLKLPLPPFQQGWDPTPNLIQTNCATLAVGLTSDITPPTQASAGRAIPSGNPWWSFGNNTDLCSRFAVLFPGPLPSMFMTHARAVFTATNRAQATWNNPFFDSNYVIDIGALTITDGGNVKVWADGTTQFGGGVTVVATDNFTGYVDLLAYLPGANPYANLNGAALIRLQNAIHRWRPGKASCNGVFALVSGNFIGWPVRTIGAAQPGPGLVAKLVGSF